MSSARSRRILASAPASALASSAAAPSIMRSACHTKPRLSWYSTGLAKRPSSIEASYSLKRHLQHLGGGLGGEAQQRRHEPPGHGERALEPLVHHLQRLLVGALALGLHGLGQRLQLAAEGADVVHLDVLLHHPVELFGRVQEMRQRLVPQPELDQLSADQDVAAHQGDVAVEADAGVARAAVGEVGLAALVRGLGGRVRAAGGRRLAPGGPCGCPAPRRRWRARRRRWSRRRCRPTACASALPCGSPDGVRPLSSQRGQTPFDTGQSIYCYGRGKGSDPMGPHMILAIADVLSAADVAEVRDGPRNRDLRRRQGDRRLGGEARQGQPAGEPGARARARARARRDAAHGACRVRAGDAAQDHPRARCSRAISRATPTARTSTTR